MAKSVVWSEIISDSQEAKGKWLNYFLQKGQEWWRAWRAEEYAANFSQKLP